MSTLPDFDMTTKNIGAVGDNIHAEGDIIGAVYQESIDPDKYAFIEENLDDVRSEKFIAPAHSHDIVQRVLLSDRFLLLLGKDRMGKAALSRHIAGMLLQANPDEELQVKKIRQNMELSEVLDALISEKTQGHIVLGYDIDIKEIQKHIDVLIRIARQNSKFIIFTSELLSSIPSGLQGFSVEVQANYPYTPQNIEKLLKQYFQPKNIELEKNIHNISKRLVSPSMAIRLAESLLKETTLPSYNEWVDRLNDLNDFFKETDKWLRKIGKDERVLFLTLALFQDLPEQDFWTVYETVIDTLRKRDHTLIKLDYYALEENREFVVLEPSIAFKHIKDRNMILLRLLKLHRRSLLKILPFLGKKIGEFKDKKDWQMRLATAEAVGYIGTVEEKAVNDTLYVWAKHKDASVRAAVGHAHRQMIKAHRQVSEDDAGKAILRILDQMSLYLCENSKERTTMEPRWTVAASLERINNYVPEDIFEQKILPIFKELYHDEHIAVRKAVVHSMYKIGLSRFKQIRPILSTMAQDHKVEVQLEVSEILARLSLSNKSGVHQLLQEWLDGQKARLWTAFYTFYCLDSRQEEQLHALQLQIYDNSDLQNKITSRLGDILISEKISDKKTIDVFNRIALYNDISMNKVLIVEIFSVNRYKKQAGVDNIVNGWIDSDEVRLKELADIIIQRCDEYKNEMQKERQHLLKNELDNDELLQEFAARLPEDERSDFSKEVEVKREERRIKQQELMKILIGVGIAVFVVLFITLL